MTNSKKRASLPHPGDLNPSKQKIQKTDHDPSLNAMLSQLVEKVDIIEK